MRNSNIHNQDDNNYNINNNNSFNFNLRRSGSGSAANSVSLLGSFAENVMPQRNNLNSDGETESKRTGRLLKKKKKKKKKTIAVNDPDFVLSYHQTKPPDNDHDDHHHHHEKEEHNNVNDMKHSNSAEVTEKKARNATENVAVHIFGLDNADDDDEATSSPMNRNHPIERRNTTRARSLVFQNAPNVNTSAAEVIPEKKSTTRRNKRREETLNFARAAVDNYGGQLEPVELAMLQTQQQASLNSSSPTHAKDIFGVAEILAAVELLNEREFALLHEATNKQSHSLSNGVTFSGSGWYLPVVTRCDKDEDQNGLYFSMEEGLTIALCGKRLTINVASILLRVLMLAAAGGVLFFALPQSLLIHHGVVFDVITTFLFCTLVGGLLARLCGLPPLLLILLSSILYANLGSPGNLTDGIVPEIRSVVSKIGLTIILLRSGLSMSWSTIKPAAPNILSMAFIPMVCEIIAHRYTASKLMDYGEDPGLWPFMQAMMTAPSASAIVGGTTLLLRTWGYGNTRGAGILLLPSAVLDMTVGIWGINFMISLLFRKPDDNIGWLVGQGVLQIIGGPIVGVLCGAVWFWILKILFREAKVLPHGKYSRNFLRRTARNGLFLFVMIGFLLVFCGYRYGIAGGGGLGVAFLGASVKFFLTQHDSPEHHLIVKDKMYSYLTSFWDLCACPMLFSLGPSSISTKSMFEADFIWRAVVCVVVGACARIVACFLCSYTYPMTRSERIIAVIASGGRATVQVALGSYAVTHVTSDPNSTPDELRFAKQVYDTSIIGVLIMTPLAVSLLVRVAPKFWLTDAQHAELDKKEKKRKKKEAVARGEQQQPPSVGQGSSSSSGSTSSSSSSSSSSSDDDSSENKNKNNNNNNNVKNCGSSKIPLGSAKDSSVNNNDDYYHSREFYDFSYQSNHQQRRNHQLDQVSPTQVDKAGFSPTEMKNVTKSNINYDDNRSRKTSFGFI